MRKMVALFTAVVGIGIGFCPPAAGQPAYRDDFKLDWYGSCAQDGTNAQNRIYATSLTQEYQGFGTNNGVTIGADIVTTGGRNFVPSTCTEFPAGSHTCGADEVLEGDRLAVAYGQVVAAEVGDIVFEDDHTVALQYFAGFSPGSHHFTIYCPQWSSCTGGHGTGCGSSPIVIPLGPSKDIRFSTPAGGVQFDIDADGEKDQVAWPDFPQSAAFLAYDKNGNGKIDDGSELFGDHTIPSVNVGFTALAMVVGNRDGAVSVADAGFAQLLLWTDLNRDGISQPDELQPASNYLVKILTFAKWVGKRDENGNEYRFQGGAYFRDNPHAKVPIYDVFLVKQ